MSGRWRVRRDGAWWFVFAPGQVFPIAASRTHADAVAWADELARAGALEPPC